MSYKFDFKTPAECRAFLDGFYAGKGPNGMIGWRKRRALKPVRMWRTMEDSRGAKFVEPIPLPQGLHVGPVVEVYTLMGEWIAYERYQMALDETVAPIY